MEENSAMIPLKLKSDNGVIYVFNTNEDNTRDIAKRTGFSTRVKNRIWQILPSVCGSLLCVSYGLILGWPSPTYPYLLKETSAIPITIDQSAMIAGFLMIGNTVATPFSSTFHLGPKYGVITGVAVMVVGWVLLWQARDIYWLLGSRFLIGAGHGYGNGQLKCYIKEMTESNITGILIKQLSLHMFFGVILAYCFGLFFDFRTFSVVSLIITIFILFICIFLPCTPKELIKNNNYKDACRLLQFLSPHLDFKEEFTKIKENLEKKSESLSFCNILKNDTLRIKYVIFVFLIFFQQFSGIPATVVYAEVIFSYSTPYPDLCAVLYGIVYFLSNIYGLFYTPKYNKKYFLLFSSFSVSVILAIQILVIYFDITVKYWNYTMLITMLIYCFLHTIGLGNIPFSFIDDFFPSEAKTVAIHTFVMLHSMFALILTKIFQVLYAQFEFHVPFCLFLTASLASTMFVWIFVPDVDETDSKLDNNHTQGIICDKIEPNIY